MLREYFTLNVLTRFDRYSHGKTGTRDIASRFSEITRDFRLEWQLTRMISEREHCRSNRSGRGSSRKRLKFDATKPSQGCQAKQCTGHIIKNYIRHISFIKKLE